METPGVSKSARVIFTLTEGDLLSLKGTFLAGIVGGKFYWNSTFEGSFKRLQDEEPFREKFDSISTSN
ncbi:MAG: hypothetical protein FWB98_03255 [Defluviitaleaceae bacterium]|nr:hypothetical protein [Defluviitaleaceae bacterium]